MMLARPKMQFYLGLVLFFIGGAVLPAFGLELRTAAQDSAPKYFRSDTNQMVGLCVDIMQAIEQVDTEIQFDGYQEFLPFPRLQNQLEAGQLDVFLGFKQTSARKKKYTFLNVPLYHLNYVIAVRKQDTSSVQNFADIRRLQADGAILTVFGSAASRFLKNQGGLIVYDGAKSPQSLVKMLMYKRGRFAFYHDLGLQHTVLQENLGEQIRILPVTFSSYPHYAAFSRHVSEQTIERVKSALDHLQMSGALTRIREKYFLQHMQK